MHQMEAKTAVKNKIKINNSYESEPSSGSGSSLSEHNEGQTFDEENMYLPYLLKPPSYSNEIIISTTCETYKGKETERLDPIEPLESSSESPFEGFIDISSDKVNKNCFSRTPPKIANLYEPNAKPTTQRPSLSKLVFPKFYDTIIEENSSNAVDLQLIETKFTKDHSYKHDNFSENKSHTEIVETFQPPSVDLSFNGKINNLNNAINNKNNSITVMTTNNEAHMGISNAMDNITTSIQATESFIFKQYNNEHSPDIFADEDDAVVEDIVDHRNIEVNSVKDMPANTSAETITYDINRSLNNTAETHLVDEPTLNCSSTQLGENMACALFRENCRRESELHRRIRRCLKGVPPPPSLTTPQLNMFETVLNHKADIFDYLKSICALNADANIVPKQSSRSIFRPTHTLEEAQTIGWRDILGVRHHGLSFNLNTASESNEYLSLSVVERFIGAETASSYRSSPSSAQKRNSRLKLLTQSPGNRLSHLAKRRAIFSSANLATTSLKSSNSLGPQILINKNKTKNKRKGTPKRSTPSSKKKTRKTPSSSARKRLYRNDLIKPGPSRETSKRALFQSPAKQQQHQQKLPSKPLIKPEIANRVEKSKRALFSPEHQTSSMSCAYAANLNSAQLNSLLLKRKRSSADVDEDVAELAAQSSKLFRANSDSLTPRALKIKSQSFCIGAGSSASTAVTATISSNFSGSTSIISKTAVTSRNGSLLTLNNSQQDLSINKMQRAHSDMYAPSNSLTENQRKKLLWAVSQALQQRRINTKHDSFKQYASVLARVVRRIFQEFYQRTSTSNSETMLRLAKKYVHNVISGKNTDDIYFHAKAQISEVQRQSSSRITGYIGPEEYQQRKLSLSQSQLSSAHRRSFDGSAQNIFTMESSMDSFGFSQFTQSSSAFCATSVTQQSQISFLERVSQDALYTQNSITSSATKSASKPKLSIQPNVTLQNSSSKSNFGGLALRENVDCDQRRSAQKNFTGKDQRNISPFAATPVTTVGASTFSSGRKVQTQVLHELCGSGHIL